LNLDQKLQKKEKEIVSLNQRLKEHLIKEGKLNGSFPFLKKINLPFFFKLLSI
jgi:hypothetical protein